MAGYYPGNYYAPAGPAGAGGDLIRAAVYAALAADADLAAVVGTNVTMVSRPEKQPAPALTFQMLSNARERTLNGPLGKSRARFRFTCYSKTALDGQAAAEAVRNLLDGYRSDTNGPLGGAVAVDWCHQEGEADTRETAADGSDRGVFETGCEYLIRYAEPKPGLASQFVSAGGAVGTPLALDTAVVHLAGAETIAGPKTFTAALTAPVVDTGGTVWNAAHWLDGSGRVDNLAALQALVNTVSAAGGGTILFPPGVYGVKPGPTTQVNLASNLRLQGTPGAVIRVMAGTGDYNTIFGQLSAAQPVVNVVIEGMTFDQNPAGNTGSNIQANSATTGQMVFSFNNAPSVRFLDCNFDVCTGVNTLNISGNTVDALVRGCRFNFSRGASTTEYDCSTVYMNTLSHRVVDNYFFAPIAQHARGAVESHNGQSVISGNVSDGYQTLCNVVDSSTPSGRDNSDINVSGNTCSRANNAIQLWSITALRNVTVSGNVISLSQIDHNEVNCAGVQCVYAATGLSGVVENLAVTGNTISFQPGDTRTVSRQGTALNASGTYAIGLAPAGNVSNVAVTGNVVRNAPVQGLTVGNGTVNNTTGNVRVSGNVFVDSGCNAAVTAGYRAAFFLAGNLANVQVKENQVVDTGSPTAHGNQYLYYSPASAVACSFRHNHVKQAAGATPVLSRTVNTQPLDTEEAVDYYGLDRVNWTRGRAYMNPSGPNGPEWTFQADAAATGTSPTMLISVLSAGGSETYVRFQRNRVPFVEFGSHGSGSPAAPWYHFTSTLLSANQAGTPNGDVFVRIDPTVQQSGTAGYTLFEVNPTVTSVGSGPQLLARFAVAGVQKAAVDASGNITGASLGLGGNTVTFGTAAPTSGTWAQGDLRWNSAAASGQPEGWRCVAAGSPGSWSPMGNH